MAGAVDVDGKWWAGGGLGMTKSSRGSLETKQTLMCMGLGELFFFLSTPLRRAARSPLSR